MSSTDPPLRSSRDKKPSGWYQDYEVSKPRKNSPGMEARKQEKPPLPPRPPRPQPNPQPGGMFNCGEEGEEVLLIATQEEEQANVAPNQRVSPLLDDKELEEQLNSTPGLAGLVELATTPVGTPMMSGTVGQAPPSLDLGSNANEVLDGEKRVTIWNPFEKRKLSGNSAPFRKNLEEYLKKHPDWEEYWGQDLDENGKKLFPRKRRRTSADPSPALSAKAAPSAKGGNSMMAGLLQLATEAGPDTPVTSPRPLGSLNDAKDAELAANPQAQQMLGSVLDSVKPKIECKVAAYQQSVASATGINGEKTALELVQDVVVDAIEESCKEGVLTLGVQPPTLGAKQLGGQSAWVGPQTTLNVASVSLASS